MALFYCLGHVDPQMQVEFGIDNTGFDQTNLDLHCLSRPVCPNTSVISVLFSNILTIHTKL